jgi:DNA-binding response OmpR family regulator
MLIEDDAALRRFLEVVLGRSHEVLSHATGEPALAALAHRAPDILVSDLMLPDLPGEEIARSAMRLERAPAVVLISGDHARLERARPLADATLSKPFTIGQLEQVVDSLEVARQRGKRRPLVDRTKR